VVDKKRNSKREAEKKTGVDGEREELVRGGHDNVNSLKVEEIHDKNEDFLVVDESQDSACGKHGQDLIKLALEISKIGEVFVHPFLKFGRGGVGVGFGCHTA